MSLLGHDLNGELAVLFDLVLEGHDQAPDELLSIVEGDQFVGERLGRDDFVELNEGLSAQVAILAERTGEAILQESLTLSASMFR